MHMPGPARVGAVIYAKHLDALTSFYRELLMAEVLHIDAEYSVLQSPDIQLVVHAIPEHIASTFEISVPPAPREETAIKLFFTVSTIEWARGVVTKLGGIFQAEKWNGQGFTACNAVDPEGNVFQVRVFSNAV
jgi:predicted enzyme related to lactoylglutathione lyase